MKTLRNRVLFVAALLAVLLVGTAFASGGKEASGASGKTVVHFAHFWVPLPNGDTDPRVVLIERWQKVK